MARRKDPMHLYCNQILHYYQLLFSNSEVYGVPFIQKMEDTDLRGFNANSSGKFLVVSLAGEATS